MNRTLPGRLARAGSVLSLSLLAFTYADEPTSAQGSSEDDAWLRPVSEGVRRSSTAVKPSVRSTGPGTDDGSGFDYIFDGKRYRFDVATSRRPRSAGGRRRRPAGAAAAAGAAAGRRARPAGDVGGFARRQAQGVLPRSQPLGRRRRRHQRDADHHRRQREGPHQVRHRQLGLRRRARPDARAIWWSPDSTQGRLLPLRREQVKDFYLQMDQTQDPEHDRRRGVPEGRRAEPDRRRVRLRRRREEEHATIDVRDGKPFDNDVVGHYVYTSRWSPDGTELLFNRTNRRQNIMEFVACNPATGESRVVVREEWPTGWVDNRPPMQFLDGQQALHLGVGAQRLRELLPLRSDREADHADHDAHRRSRSARSSKVDEAAGVMFYMARDGDNHMKLQLHRVGLDGKGDVRLTDPKFNHTVGGCMAGGGGGGAAEAVGSCGISPDNKYFVDVYQTHDKPPATRLVDATGKVVAELAKSDMTKFDAARPEEGRDVHLHGGRRQDELYGMIQFPSNFDPSKKYPALVLGLRRPGVGSNMRARELRDAERDHRIRLPGGQPRLARGAGQGQADARRDLPEARSGRDGRHGGGHQGAVDAAVLRQGAASASTARRTAATASAMSILRYPDVFAAASAVVAGDRLAPLRHDLHRALHVDPAGEQGRLRRRAAR